MGVKGLLVSSGRGTILVLPRLQAIAMLSLAFPMGVRCLKVRGGFVPFHAPRELSIAMKEVQEMGGIMEGPGNKRTAF